MACIKYLFLWKMILLFLKIHIEYMAIIFKHANSDLNYLFHLGLSEYGFWIIYAFEIYLNKRELLE